MAGPTRNWSRSETLAALHIYLQLPFGQLHHNHPQIKQLSDWIRRTPSSVALKLVNLASLDPQIVASGRKGMGNVSALDKAIWYGLLSNWDFVALEAAAEYEQLAKVNGLPPDFDVLEELQMIEEGKTRLATIQARVNQARFRKAVLAGYNSTCCISGLRHEKLVIASHIVPWSKDKGNRLNPQNGLCLSALHDRAYDQGLITVMPDLTIRVSPALKKTRSASSLMEMLALADGQTITRPEKFAPQANFLEWHAKRFGFL